MTNLLETVPEPRTFSYSKLQTWDRCRYKYGLAYIDEWTKTEKAKPLQLGTMLHELLADWYITGQDNSIKFASNWFDVDDLSSDTAQAISTAIWLYQLYIEYAPTALDAGLKVKYVERYFKVPLVTPKGRRYFLEGYADAVFEDTYGQLWLVEHKTSTRFWTQMEILLDPQLTYYAGAMRENGLPIFGIILNQLNTYAYKNREGITGDKVFKREKTYRTPKEMDSVVREVGNLVDDILDYEHSRTRSLSRDCKMCDFNEVCLYDLKGIDSQVTLSANFKKKEARPPQVDESQPVPVESNRVSF